MKRASYDMRALRAVKSTAQYRHPGDDKPSTDYLKRTRFECATVPRPVLRVLCFINGKQSLVKIDESNDPSGDTRMRGLTAA